MDKVLYFGIDANASDDPSKDKSGVATWETGAETLTRLDMLGFVDLLKAFKAATKSNYDKIVLRIEIPASGGKVDNVVGIYNSTITYSNKFAAINAVAKKGYQVGRNAELANRIAEVGLALGFRVERVARQSRQRCDGDDFKAATAEALKESIEVAIDDDPKSRPIFLSKIDKDRFKKLFNYKGRTNEDKRDAALLLLPEFLGFVKA